MSAPIDTLSFAQRFENAGFDHEQARVLAVTFGEASDSIREGLVTKDHLDLRLAELENRLNKQFADLETKLTRQFGDMETKLTRQFGDLEVRLTRHVGEVGKDVTGRFWSAVAIIAGVSTAVSATIGAGITLLLRSGAL